MEDLGIRDLLLNARPSSVFSQTFSTLVALTILLVVVASLAGQNTAGSLAVLSREGRRTIPLARVGDQEMVALDDLATSFQLAVREEVGALTVSYRGRTIVLTPAQALASVSGRLVSLSTPPARFGNRWMVPLDFISQALALVYDARLDLRRASRLLIVGDLRVPRVNVRHEFLGNAARVTIDATPRATSTVTAEGTQRITIRFDADAIEPVFSTFQPQGFVQGFRTVDAVTVAIDLGPRFGTFRASSLTVNDIARVVLDLLPAAETTSSPTIAPPDPAPPELPVFGPPPGGIRTLTIDAGHGGDDPGARGGRGTVEKNVTLGVARRLKAAVEARLGIRVVMTRDDDRNVSANDRTALANNNKADLFISLHANASFRSAVAGAAVYVASFEDSAPAREALAPERLPAFGGGYRDIELVPWNLAQIRHRTRSSEMANLLAERFQDRVPLATRAVDHAPLRVLESANMPAVLIEMGYVSNPDQEKQLADGDFQNALVQAILEAIVRFRDGPAADRASR
jgi:N-acetylmuramoyl-L-alanine amidase